MKKNEALTPALLLLTVALAGCDPSPSKPVQPTTTAGVGVVAAMPSAALESVTVNPDPIPGILDDVRSLKYDDRSNVSAITDKLDRQVTALMAQWVAHGRQFSDDTEKGYREKRRVLAQKFRELTFATPETWASVKEEAALALQDVRRALHTMDMSSR